MSNKNVPIKYTARDFDSIKAELVEYAKKYYPNNYKDFSEGSFGSLMLDLTSYIGDTLSFYLDYQANETFLLNAIEKRNVLSNARTLGYKYKSSYSSTGFCQIYIKVPADTISDGPNLDYIPILRAGANLYSSGGISFILCDDVNFSDDNTMVVVGEINSSGVVQNYILKKDAKVISGSMEVIEAEITAFKKFLKVNIDDVNMVEIISVEDSDGNQYYEVDNLSQNIVYEFIPNLDMVTSTVSPYKLREIVALRRFTVERNGDNGFYLQFGYGSESTLIDGNIADPSSVIINEFGKDYVSDTKFDPTKLINGDNFGIAPANTILKIKYRSNNTNDVNVRANSLTSMSGAQFIFSNSVSQVIQREIQQTIEVDNEEPITGDVTDPDVDEIKIRALDNFSTQDRAVTRRDYISCCYNMPSKLGSIKRVNLVQDPNSFKRNLNLYVISEDQDGYLTSTNVIIKQNLLTWLQKYKMINDTIDILDAKIVNVNIEFEVLCSNLKNKTEVLQKCLSQLKVVFKNKLNIGEVFSVSDVYGILNKVDGVTDTTKVVIKVNNGTGYSQISFNIDEYTTADNKNIIIPEDYILEIKNLNTDIKGTVI